MANVYLARLNPSDYAMVRGILNNDLPVIYEEWLRCQAKGENDFARQGHSVSHLPIDPDELARYCGNHGGHRSHHGLSHFAIKQSQGERY